MKLLLALSACVVFSTTSFSETIYVPGNYSTLQEAVNGAAEGDVILVHAGTYVENVDFQTKEVTLRSIHGPAYTVIDGNQNGSVVAFTDFVGSGAVLDGFSITNGTGHHDTDTTGLYCGGGISCFEYATPRLVNNIIYGNTADMGGGIGCVRAIPEILNNIIYDNSADSGGGIACFIALATQIRDNTIFNNTAVEYGGGLHIYLSQSVISNNVVYENSAEHGGGIDCQVNGDALIWNCTFSGNTATLLGGGLHSSFSAPEVKNSIFWGDDAPTDPEISVNLGSLTLTYSDVQGGWADTGNIDADPLFYDAASGDFLLRQDPCQPSVVNPCVDTGDPSSAVILGSTRTDFQPDQDVADMGFHRTDVLLVPDVYPTVQQAIYAADRLDTVLVAPGTYYERLDFWGKIITVKSMDGPETTVLDGNNVGTVVFFYKEEGLTTKLDGFTIRNGSALKGGGIYCVDALPEVMNCIIKENTADRGGGIYCESDAVFSCNRIVSNDADEGGGIFLDQSTPVLESNVIADNSADAGGGIYCLSNSSPCLLNCTLYNNHALSAGGGLFCVGSTPSVKNSIFWVNSALYGPEIDIYSGSVDVTYSVFTAGWPGVGNFAENPQFEDPGALDLHLAFTSPCINRGFDGHIAALDMDGEARPYMGTVDVGADECTQTLPLECDTFTLSETAGGTINFTLYGGVENAWVPHLLLGSVSGTLPGFPLPGGNVSLRLNWDIFTDIVASMLNTTAFHSFANQLNVLGWSSAQLNSGPLPPGYAGLEIHFAYCLGWPWEFVSNPVMITISP